MATTKKTAPLRIDKAFTEGTLDAPSDAERDELYRMLLAAKKARLAAEEALSRASDAVSDAREEEAKCERVYQSVEDAWLRK